MRERHYEIVIQWSPEDEAFVAEAPELPGCISHGDTYEAALRNVRDAMEGWISTALEDGAAIPEPRVRRSA